MTPTQNLFAHIVDDDAAVRDSTQALLHSWRIPAQTYASGDDFLQKLTPATFGCIILDLHMPDISGFQMLDILRKRGCLIPVILFTGRADPATEELARQSGAVALLAKPVREDELIGLVQRLLDPNNAMGPPPFTSGQCTPRAA
ncbi:MAG: response regulator [Rhizomicrobium sp.]|jgi:two-component system response regulator FixJ